MTPKHLFPLAAIALLVTACGQASAGHGAQATTRTTARTQPKVVVQPCRSAELRPKVVLSTSTMSQPFAVISLTNTGSGTCTLRGYPKISAVGTQGRGDIRPLSVTLRKGVYERKDPGPHAVVLAPGKVASFAVGTATAYAGGKNPRSIERLGITLPGMGSALQVPVHLSATAPKNAPIPVGVTAVQSGIATTP